ncbi:MAG: helix-turn-helix domain-containing protein [Peptococcaceae bacterium]|nr:helix-turn-helix domain-containing protein [Peptococcaceae bacterium]
MTDNIFAKRLEWLLKFKNIEIGELAKYVGVKPPAIYALLRGDNSPSGHSLIKIAERLNVSIDYLVGRVDDYNTIVVEDGEEPLKEEILFIRRMYQRMTEDERRVIKALFKALVEDRPK